MILNQKLITLVSDKSETKLVYLTISEQLCNATVNYYKRHVVYLLHFSFE